MRNRAGATDVLLIGAVLMWAFNFPVTKYVLTNGFEPLAYAAVRYGVATAIFAALVIAVERSLAVRGAASWRFLALAVVALLLNQICFVYALELTTAATAALILGTTPVFTVLISYLIGVERITARTALAAAVSFGGVALVAAGSGGYLSRDLAGIPSGRDGGDLGRALGRDSSPDAELLAVPDQCRRPARHVGSAVRDQRSSGDVTGLLRPRLGRVARPLAYAMIGPLPWTWACWARRRSAPAASPTGCAPSRSRGGSPSGSAPSHPTPGSSTSPTRPAWSPRRCAAYLGDRVIGICDSPFGPRPRGPRGARRRPAHRARSTTSG